MCPLDNIQTLSGDIVTPNDILSYFTRASTETPLGFDRKPKLYFSDQTLASASTCGLQLTLPIHKSYEGFKDAMILLIKGHDGFGKS